jgi:hypothetical protein
MNVQPTTKEQYNGEDILCADSFNMVTTTPSSDNKIFVTHYEKDMFNDVWVMKWIMKKEA